MPRILLPLLAATVALLAGFYGGFKIGQGHPATAAPAGQTPAGIARAGGRGGDVTLFACPTASPASGADARRGAAGVIRALSNGTFTVHDARCNTDVGVVFDSGVIVRKAVSGQASELQENQTVTVQGQRQPDGTIKANVITIVPPGARPGGPGAGG